MSLVLLFLFGLSTLIDAKDKEVFICKSGHYSAGENASITCSFDKDVSALDNYHFYVEWYPFDRPDDTDGIEVLACFRILSGKLVCRPRDGFHVKGSIGQNLTLEIPNVGTEHAGRYSCQYIPPGGKRVEACRLTVQAAVQKPSTTRVPRHNSSDTSPKTHTHTGSTHAVNSALIGVCLTLIVGVCIAFLICFIRRRKKARAKRCTLTEECDLQEAHFKEWCNTLPKPVRRALSKNGFNHLVSFRKMTALHVRELGLKEGHAILLEEKLKNLPAWIKNPYPVAMEGASVDNLTFSDINVAIQTRQHPMEQRALSLNIIAEQAENQDTRLMSQEELKKYLSSSEGGTPRTRAEEIPLMRRTGRSSYERLHESHQGQV